MNGKYVVFELDKSGGQFDLGMKIEVNWIGWFVCGPADGWLVLNNIKLNDRHLRLLPFTDEVIKIVALSYHPNFSCYDGAYGDDVSFCETSEWLRPTERMTSSPMAWCCLLTTLLS